MFRITTAAQQPSSALLYKEITNQGNVNVSFFVPLFRCFIGLIIAMEANTLDKVPRLYIVPVNILHIMEEQ